MVDVNNSEKADNWRSVCSAELLSSLAGIRESEHAISASTSEDFEYSVVFQQQINRAIDALTRDGTMLRETIDTPMGPARKVTQQITLPPEVSRAHIYNQARVGTMVRTQVQAALRAISRLLRGADLALEEVNFHTALVCYRGSIEQVGHLALVAKQLGALSEPTNFDESCRILNEAYDLMAKRLYSTRVSWMALAQGHDFDELIRKDRVAYEEHPERVNVEAASCLKGVDLLDKKTKGTRAIYNILCEFTHPNVGNLIISTVQASPREDSQGVFWIDKALSSDTAPLVIKQMPQLMEWIFKVVDLVLRDLQDRIVPDLESSEARILRTAQVFTKEMLKRNRNLMDPYAPCPCGSGKKLRFCCGKS
jgi:hypothetical protein